MLTVVTMREIEQVFEILADLGVSREAVTIPLRPAHPGGVRLLPNHRIEIVLDSQAPLADTLQHVRSAIESILASPQGDLVQRED
jgi:hypothetical protein